MALLVLLLIWLYIYDYIKQNNYKTAIDVGTYKGGSAILISIAMGENSKVYTIDLGDLKKEQILMQDQIMIS